MTVLTAILDEINTENEKKFIIVKSIPASTTEYLLSCVEKHFNLIKELNEIIVWKIKSNIFRAFASSILKKNWKNTENSMFFRWLWMPNHCKWDYLSDAFWNRFRGRRWTRWMELKYCWEALIEKLWFARMHSKKSRQILISKSNQL